MWENTDKVKVGVLMKPHGVSGQILLKVLPQWEGYSPDPSFVFLDVDGGLVPFEAISLRVKNDSEWIVELDTIESGESAQKFQGACLYMSKSELGEIDEDDIRSSHFVGYQVNDNVYGDLGEILSIVEIHNNPLMELSYKGKELLIPLQEDFVLSIDAEKRMLYIETPEGLIDLYLE